MGKTLVIVGVVLIIIGVLWQLLGRLIPLGRLPGDLFFKNGQVSFYFPIVTCIVISIVLSILFSLFRR
ncbi:DUF2905 domain-containing protein [Shouchella patagoniensis]|uniref:DUF2905 domain-containing protein n=1 Tax=Shouchella patagoniensis TaxID=228576 RepID=UPI000995A230|nr:DUF2905 domain-containing protein [Shouchella patagoniensis]